MLTAEVDFHLEPGGRRDDMVMWSVQAFILTSGSLPVRDVYCVLAVCFLPLNFPAAALQWVEGGGADGAC